MKTALGILMNKFPIVGIIQFAIVLSNNFYSLYVIFRHSVDNFGPELGTHFVINFGPELGTHPRHVVITSHKTENFL